MQTHLLRLTLAIAIVGPVLASLPIVFRRRLLRAFFPNMEIGQAYRFLAVICMLSWSLAMAGVVIWVYSR